MEHEGQRKEKTEGPREARPVVLMSGFCQPPRKTSLPFHIECPHSEPAVVPGVLSPARFQLTSSHFIQNRMPDQKEAAGSWIPCPGVFAGLSHVPELALSSAGNEVAAQKTTEDGKFSPESLLGYLPTRHCVGDLM